LVTSAERYKYKCTHCKDKATIIKKSSCEDITNLKKSQTKTALLPSWYCLWMHVPQTTLKGEVLNIERATQNLKDKAKQKKLSFLLLSVVCGCTYHKQH
jgi:hypothetical protein